jgi:hypothetical protein
VADLGFKLWTALGLTAPIYKCYVTLHEAFTYATTDGASSLWKPSLATSIWFCIVKLLIVAHQNVSDQNICTCDFI